jgi:hypothetical protein
MAVPFNFILIVSARASRFASGVICTALIIPRSLNQRVAWLTQSEFFSTYNLVRLVLSLDFKS